jgi:aldehyde dehydrogenase (NAD+)
LIYILFEIMIQDISIDSFQEVFDLQRAKAKSLRTISIRHRKDNLKRMLRWIYDHRADILEALNGDMGKSAVEVDVSELQPVTTEIKLAIANIHKWSRRKRVAPTLLMLGTKASIQFEPKGTCLIIAPWNFPFNLTLAPLVSALAAGNTAIVKPSERTPQTTNLIQRMVDELFDPTEVVVVKGAVEETQALLKLPFDHIFFTGSPQVGKIVMSAAAQNLTSVTLELGGKSPAIVDETVNVKDAAKKLTWGKFLNCGQTCIAPDYILVQESKHLELIAALKERTDLYYNTDKNGIEQSNDYSRIVDAKHLQSLTVIMDDATDKGAKIEMGGEIDQDDNYFPPTILSAVSFDAKVMQDEIFGPILPIITYQRLEDAIDIINDKAKPLALYIFSTSRKNKEKIIRETSSGGLNINDNVIQFSHLNLPFGGVNNSGIGKSHGYHGFLAFSNEKPILEQRIGLTGISLFYPPYNKYVKKLTEFVVRFF